MENEFLKGKKILVVEDDSSSRLYLNKILEKAGVLILNAGDGEEAVTVALNNDVDIILMDIQLPIIDGYAAMEKIREVKKDIIIIAQTAYGLMGDREKILNSGFTDFIIKPILYQNLIEKLVSNLDKKK
jgi:hypothetical protein